MDIHFDCKKVTRLEEILKRMNVPKEHKSANAKNIPWLHRNLHIRNRKSPNYQEAVEIIDEFLKIIIKNTP